MFSYSSRQYVSLVIQTVRQSLYNNFVPQNLGPAHINRNQFIAEHVTGFANQLFNNKPENPKVIICIDATYVSIERSKNFQTLRQSYSVHKHCNS